MRRLWALIGLIGLFAALLGSGAAASASDIEVQSRALQRASDSVLGLKVTAVDGARSGATLGQRREGSGVLIGADGLVLTIGYLILEAEEVMLQTDDGRQWPARVVAYDVATGFGLVQSLVPLKVEPAPVGNSAEVAAQEPLMMASGGDDGAVSITRLVSRRAFSGAWEYHLDEALFTAPARRDHSGAGLFNGRGELVGVGSLWVADAMGAEGARVGGNMFVPVDLLKPVLAELRSRGSSTQSQRAWMGLQCSEAAGVLRVSRVNPDSPADVAGLEAGDTVVRIDGLPVSTLESLYKALWRGGPPERDVVLDLMRKGEALTLTVRSVDRMKTFKRAQGV